MITRYKLHHEQMSDYSGHTITTLVVDDNGKYVTFDAYRSVTEGLIKKNVRLNHRLTEMKIKYEGMF